MSFAFPANVSAGPVLEELKSLAGPLCQSVKIFDVYELEGGEEKSISFRLIFRSPKETLKEENLQQLHKKIVSRLTKKWSIKIR